MVHLMITGIDQPGRPPKGKQLAPSADDGIQYDMLYDYGDGTADATAVADPYAMR